MSVWSNRKVRYTAAFAGVTAIAVPAGIGLATSNSVASPPDAPAQVAAAVAKAKANIKKLPDSQLLTSSQLGSGWTTVDLNKVKKLVNKKAGTLNPEKLKSLLGNITVSPTECSNLLKLPNIDSVTGVGFRAFQKKGSSFGPYAGTAVIRFTDATAAAAALQNAREVAAACSDVTVSTKYGDANATVSPLTVPAVGDERVGYKIEANLAGFISVEGQVSAVRKGKRIVIVGQGGLNPSAALTKSLTKKAAAKL